MVHIHAFPLSLCFALCGQRINMFNLGDLVVSRVLVRLIVAVVTLLVNPGYRHHPQPESRPVEPVAPDLPVSERQQLVTVTSRHWPPLWAHPPGPELQQTAFASSGAGRSCPTSSASPLPQSPARPPLWAGEALSSPCPRWVFAEAVGMLRHISLGGHILTHLFFSCDSHCGGGGLCRAYKRTR